MPELSLPTTFGRYELQELIGQGGMAEIYRATLAGLQGFEKELVIKKILHSYANNEAFIQMLIQEAKLASGLHHANIVQIFDLGAVDREYYIAMEYVPGRDLLRTLARCTKRGCRFPFDLAAHVVAEVARGLDYAHRATDIHGRPLKIIHRDISPSNVLVSFNGDVKVTDFGVARAGLAHENVTRTGVLKGKIGYMSPEQVAGRPFDARSDIFSLGTILYETITLKRLFLGRTDLETLLNIRDCRIDAKFSKHGYIPQEIQAMLRRALTMDPDDRYPTAGEFGDELRAYLRAIDSPASPDILSRYIRSLWSQDDLPLSSEPAFLAEASPTSSPTTAAPARGPQGVGPAPPLETGLPEPPTRETPEVPARGASSEMSPEAERAPTARIEAAAQPSPDPYRIHAPGERTDELRNATLDQKPPGRRGSSPRSRAGGGGTTNSEASAHELRITESRAEASQPVAVGSTPSTGGSTRRPPSAAKGRGKRHRTAAAGKKGPGRPRKDDSPGLVSTAGGESIVIDNPLSRSSTSRGESLHRAGQRSDLHQEVTLPPSSLQSATFRLRRSSGDVFGPVTYHNLLQLIHRGAVSPTELISIDNQDWVSVDAVSALRPLMQRNVGLKSRPASMDGPISLLGLPYALYRIAGERISGLLTAERGSELKEAYFRGGRLVQVLSNIKSELFGTYLVHRGHITEAQILEALGELREYGGRLGDVLVSRRWIEPVHLAKILEEHQIARLSSLLAWDGGWYALHEGDDFHVESMTAPLPTAKVTTTALRALLSPSFLEAVFADFVVDPVREARRPYVKLEELGLKSREFRVARTLLRAKHLNAAIQAAERFRGRRTEVLTLAYTLLQAGVLEFPVRSPLSVGRKRT